MDLFRLFPTVTHIEVEAVVVDLPPEQVRRLVNIRVYGPSAEMDIENADDVQQLSIDQITHLHHTTCNISIYSILN